MPALQAQQLAAAPPVGSAQPAASPQQSPPPSLDPVPQALPLAPAVKGSRPKSNPSLLPPAAKTLDSGLGRLASPASLALPTKVEEVRIQELRPLSLKNVENLAEVNNPNLKAIASQVDQAQSNLRAQIASWYPTLSLNAGSLPAYTGGSQRTSFDPDANQGIIGNLIDDPIATSSTSTSRWALAATLTAQWALINPQRVPQVSAARDQFEQAKNQYLIALRELRLQAAQAYFQLQLSDDRVRIGQESVRASLVSLRDAKARFQAGVATKLEVLEAETQLARDQQLLTDSLSEQSIARRDLARILDLPQNITPTAKEPLRPLGVWIPSIQESIIAAYAFREELDNAILSISVSNSQANSALGSVQPFLNVFNSLVTNRYTGNQGVLVDLPGSSGWAVDNSVGMNLTWNIFDGGAARAQYRQSKQRAQENSFNFARTRDQIRFDVEQSFYQLGRANRNIQTTSREVASARESLRLARLRFQAGVSTQREVVDNQRDLTQAEVRYSNALADYNSNLAQLRRRTGLDQVAICQPPALSATKPIGDVTVPVPPEPLQPACQASSKG
ncbi:TolC family protein [Synechococcus sp. HJ21-Hayes]|uniref:TolC family protein n=1 Tax=Synechococcus sp. HJ21-Hayes TaxID=2823736 RepID=UPI0020CF5B11|nr:TolC family protein [Synechococcus sp. HJ21-Hayes]MCP9853984.1 TolC family protein [Synechococcus sp. HJ21-Hayes]